MLNKSIPVWMLAINIFISACSTVPVDDTTTPTVSESDQEKSATETVNQPQEAPAATEPSPSEQAMDLIKAGDIDRAIEQYTRIVNEDPKTPNAYTNLGLLYMHRKQTDLAKTAFEQAILIDNQDAVAYNNLAIIQRQQGEFKKALFNYYKAIKARPDYANAHLNLGILLDLYMQDLPAALENYQRYQELTGNADEKVAKWIIDLKRRIEAETKK